MTTRSGSADAHRRNVIQSLAAYRERYPQEADVVAEFEAFVRAEPRCFERDCRSGHVTGSAWVVNAAGTHVLLTHHRKLNRWLQLGGHCDGDGDVAGVACREAAEESGLAVEPVSPDIFDIDIHPIPARRADPAHLHFDTRFLLRVVGSDAFRVSDESLALRWVNVDDMESLTSEPSMLRMARKALAQIGAAVISAGSPASPRTDR
jgi:8-oxo-dGTP pyrophosphatase MutT (NUDIX family)